MQWQLMGLQHHDPSGELPLVVGLHGPQDVSILVCLMGALWCGGDLAAYAVDMVQLCLLYTSPSPRDS